MDIVLNGIAFAVGACLSLQEPFVLYSVVCGEFLYYMSRKMGLLVLLKVCKYICVQKY